MSGSTTRNARTHRIASRGQNTGKIRCGETVRVLRSFRLLVKHRISNRFLRTAALATFSK